MLSGENGAQFGWFDTLRDQVGALPLDPVLRNQILQQLRVADIASQASLYKNSKGPLERNAGTILPALGAGVGVLLHGAPAEAMMGGMAGNYFRAQGTAGLRALDGIMGNGLPDILQRQGAIEKFAQDNGLSSVADPMALQNMNAQLRGLATQAPLGPQMAAAAQQAAQARQGPMTASGQGYTGQPLQAPVATPQAAQSAPAPASAPAPMAPGSGAPVTPADRLARLSQAQAAAPAAARKPPPRRPSKPAQTWYQPCPA